MIITCPHCDTRYQVAHEAIGSAGRKVECASCHEAWFARAEEDDTFLDPVFEDALDEQIEAEARAAEPPPREPEEQPPAEPPTDPHRISDEEMRRRQREFLRRRRHIGRLQPGARLRRLVRLGVLVTLVAGLTGAVLGREAIVRTIPDLAGLYDRLGLTVNVVGLEFTRVNGMLSRREGRPVLIVRGEVRGVSNQAVPFPPMLVSLVDEHGDALYRWSIAPPVASLAGGERVPFESQMVNPPPSAAGISVGFGTVGALSVTPAMIEGSAHSGDASTPHGPAAEASHDVAAQVPTAQAPTGHEPTGHVSTGHEAPAHGVEPTSGEAQAAPAAGHSAAGHVAPGTHAEPDPHAAPAESH
jgi:predicted Zn finger-like uncharacterized protein